MAPIARDVIKRYMEKYSAVSQHKQGDTAKEDGELHTAHTDH
jgi:hypothetical protein